MADSCHTFVKIYECTTKKPNFVIMTNKSHFISCNPCTTQMQDADSGEVVCVCVCVCVCLRTCSGQHIENKGQLVRVCSLASLCVGPGDQI